MKANSDELITFVTVVECGSFSRAAEEVGLTQSAISHQMRLLEGQVGQPLFLRIGRVGNDRIAGSRHARRIGQRQVTLVGQALGGHHRDLAAGRAAVVFEGGGDEILVHVSLFFSLVIVLTALRHKRSVDSGKTALIRASDDDGRES